MKTLHKKDLRGDEFQDTVDIVYGYWAEHRDRLLYGAGALVALVLAGYFAWFFWNRAENHASFMLADGFRAYDKRKEDGTWTDENAALARQKFNEVVEQHPRSRAAQMARWMLVSMDVNAADWAKAEEQLSEMAKRRDDYGVLARYQLAHVQASRGQAAEAIAALEALLAEEQRVLTPEVLNLAIARIAVASGDIDTAERRYGTVVSDYPNTVAAQNATAELAEIRKDKPGSAS